MLKHPHAQHSHHKARDPGPPPFPKHMAPLYHSPPNQGHSTADHYSLPRTPSLLTFRHTWLAARPKPGWLQWPHFSSVSVFLQLSFVGKKLPACVDWGIIRESLSQVDSRHWLPTRLPLIKELRFPKFDYLTPSPLSSNPSPQPWLSGDNCPSHSREKTESRKKELLSSSLCTFSQPNFFFKGLSHLFSFQSQSLLFPSVFKWRIISNIFRKLQRVP